MWLFVFLAGIAVVVRNALARDPVWFAAGAAYIYFVIPMREYHVPDGPWQLAFWTLAVLTSPLFVTRSKKVALARVRTAALDATTQAIATVQDELCRAIVDATVEGRDAGDIRNTAASKVENATLDAIDAKAPAAIAIPLSQAAMGLIARAAELGEREALRVKEASRGIATGALRTAIDLRVQPTVRSWLDSSVESTVHQALDAAIQREGKDAKEPSARRGIFGIPIERGPHTALLSNAGLWFHFAFILASWQSARTAQYDQSIAMATIEVLFKLYIPMIAIVCTMRTAEHFRLFTFAWLFGVWQLSMNGITYWLRYGGRADNIGGQGGEANFLGALVCSVVPITLGMMLDPRSRRLRAVGTFGSACFALGMLASGSRGAFVGFVGAAGYWYAFTSRKFVASALGVVALVSFLFVAPDSFWERIATIGGGTDSSAWTESDMDPAKRERLVLWGLAIDLWKENKAWGIGPKNYPIVSAAETDFVDAYEGARGLQAHNTWLQLLAEYGTIGTAIWAGAFVFSMFCFRRARKRMNGYAGWEWYSSLCLGFEAGAIGIAVTYTFSSFQWYDFVYWYMVAGPLALQIARDTTARLDWMKGVGLPRPRPPPRYEAPAPGSLDLERIDLAGTLAIEPRTESHVPVLGPGKTRDDEA